MEIFFFYIEHEGLWRRFLLLRTFTYIGAYAFVFTLLKCINMRLPTQTYLWHKCSDRIKHPHHYLVLLLFPARNVFLISFFRQFCRYLQFFSHMTNIETVWGVWCCPSIGMVCGLIFLFFSSHVGCADIMLWLMCPVC